MMRRFIPSDRRSLRRPVLPALLAICALTLAAPIRTDREVPLSPDQERTVLRLFFENGALSSDKVNAYDRLIRHRYDEIRDNLERHYRLREGMSRDEAGKEAREKKISRIYRMLREDIEMMRRARNPREARRISVRILDLDYALLMEGPRLKTSEMVTKLTSMLAMRSIPAGKPRYGEAVNLVDPADGHFLTREELKAWKRNGRDISRLNPPSDSGFWSDVPTKDLDVAAHYLGGGHPMYAGLRIEFPERRARLEGIIFSQTKPKLEVAFRRGGNKRTFKMKIGAEMHSEPTVSALADALGFPVDIVKYFRDFKVVLGDMSPVEFRRQWNSYYYRYPLDDYIASQGRDADGWYLVFHEASLEAKPADLTRVGIWGWMHNGHADRREVRGSVLFNLWVANQDMKPSENNRLLMRGEGGDREFYYIVSDLGYGFGTLLKERPSSFGWDMIRYAAPWAVYLEDPVIERIPWLKRVSFADARWMTRLIARLSRAQIQAAVDLGHWPEPLARLLVEKLISRRNRLVEAFGLDGERRPDGSVIEILPVDRGLTTADGAVRGGRARVTSFPGYTQDFDPELKEIVEQVLTGLRNLAVDGIVSVTGGIDFIRINPEWFGIDENIVSHVILRFNREIEKNDAPVAENESFLVKDSMEVGIRLGYGRVISGEAAYIKKYVLVYPVRTYDRGRFQGGFILNTALRARARGEGVPEKYVLVTEDFIEGRGRLRFEGETIVALGDEAALARVRLGRHILSRKHPDKLVFAQDISEFTRLSNRIYVKLFQASRLNIHEWSRRDGWLTRELVEVDLGDLGDNTDKARALEAVTLRNDPGPLKKLGVIHRLRDDFQETASHFRFAGIWNRSRMDRFDRIGGNLRRPSIPDDTSVAYLQVESRRKTSWAVADNSEIHTSLVRLNGVIRGRRLVAGPQALIEMNVLDHSTGARELRDDYIAMLNAAAGEEGFIDFDPTRHTTNQAWGRIRIRLRMALHPEGLDRLVTAEAADVWRMLSDETGRSVDYWRKRSRPGYVRGRPVFRGRRPEDYLARRTRFFIRELARAGRESDDVDRLRRISGAVRKTVFKNGATFEPALIAVIRRLAGPDNFFLSAEVTMPEDRELLLPGGKPFYNEMGDRREPEIPVYFFVLETPGEIYHIF